MHIISIVQYNYMGILYQLNPRIKLYAGAQQLYYIHPLIAPTHGRHPFLLLDADNLLERDMKLHRLSIFHQK